MTVTTREELEPHVAKINTLLRRDGLQLVIVIEMKDDFRYNEGRVLDLVVSRLRTPWHYAPREEEVTS